MVCSASVRPTGETANTRVLSRKQRIGPLCQLGRSLSHVTRVVKVKIRLGAGPFAAPKGWRFLRAACGAQPPRLGSLSRSIHTRSGCATRPTPHGGTPILEGLPPKTGCPREPARRWPADPALTSTRRLWGGRRGEYRSTLPCHKVTLRFQQTDLNRILTDGARSRNSSLGTGPITTGPFH